MDVGCVLVGAVAIGVLSAETQKRRSHHQKGPFSSTGVTSACQAMRAAIVGRGRGAATPARATAASAKRVTTTEEVDGTLYDSMDQEALDAQLVSAGRQAAKLRTKPAPIRAIKELTPIDMAKGGVGPNRDFAVGRFQFEPKLPKQLPTDCVGLPMNGVMEAAYEIQHAVDSTVGDAKEDMPWINDLMGSVMHSSE